VKKIETTLKHYGVEHHMQSSEIIEKSKQTCLEKYGVEHVSQIPDIKDRKQYKQAIINYQQLSKYKNYVLPNFGFSEYLKNGLHNQSWICVKCSKIFTQEYHYTTEHIKELQTCPRCLNCYPLNKPISNLEKELVEFCKQYYPNLIENDKSLIKPKELDIVIPELKLAIEFNR
jgi:transposase-like protein